MYQPNPIDTKEVQLSPALLALTERLAENVHENWAKERLAEGWVYGPTRDGDKKTTPCLVPYDQLPDSEKEYDRVTAMETLKAMVALGYRIEKI